MHATLLQFAHVNDALAQTRSKLAKQKNLAEFFRSLSNPTFDFGVRFAAGRPFPDRERTLNVGLAVLLLEVAIRLGIEPGKFSIWFAVHGETAKHIGRSWPDLPTPITAPLNNHACGSGRRLGLGRSGGHGRHSPSRLLAPSSPLARLPREAAYVAKIHLRGFSHRRAGGRSLRASDRAGFAGKNAGSD